MGTKTEIWCVMKCPNNCLVVAQSLVMSFHLFLLDENKHVHRGRHKIMLVQQTWVQY